MANERIKAAQPEANSGESMVQLTGLRLSPNDRIRQLIRMELFRQAAGKEDAESFEEADDFDFDDGDEWHSDYENEFEPVAPAVEIPVEPSPPVTPAPPVPAGNPAAVPPPVPGTKGGGDALV